MNNKQQTNLLNKKFKFIIWIKNFSILYNLLIFSKKRLKYNFINFPSDLFFILLLPLVGYTLDKKFFLYNNSNSEFFFKKTLPGLNNCDIIISSNLNWETFNYTEYFKKINWNKLKKINYFDNSIFVCFNSNLYNKNFYIGTQIKNNNLKDNKYINSNKLLQIGNESKRNRTNFFLYNKNIKNIEQNKQLNKYFISGRFFNKFFKPCIYNKKNNNLLYKYNSNYLLFNNNNLKINNFKKIKNWQNFFYDLDYIPIKLDNIFIFNNNTLNIDLKNNLLNKTLFNNIFFYSNTNKINFFTNYELKESKKKSIIQFLNFKTIIEKQNKRLNYELCNKQISYNLWNFRFFQYKIYNKFNLLKYFINNQVNTFNYNKKNLSNISNLLLTKQIIINKNEIKPLEKEGIFLNWIENQKEPNWKNLLRKDLKNLGNTRNEKFFNLDKINTQVTNFIDLQDNNINSLNLEYNKNENNNLFFFKNTIKTPISLTNRENKNLLTKIIDNKKNLKNNKLYDFNINNKKCSFIPSIEKELFSHLHFLIKKNKSLDLKSYSDKIIFFVFKKYNFINFSEKSSIEINNDLKKNFLLKSRIIEANSDLLKRKMSGYLYPDNKKTNSLFINKSSLFNNSFIKIQGQKNLIYKDFKKFYNNLFFLYNEKNLINYNLGQNNYNNKNKDIYLSNKNNLIINKFFFGNSLMDFGLAFNYDTNLNLKTKKENDKINYKPNLNLIYNKRRLDTTIPFSYQSPIKDDLLINYNYYYNSLFFNKKNFSISSSTKLSNKFFNKNLNNYKLLEINDYNEISLFPISYKSHFEYNKNYDFLNSYYSTFIKNFKNIFNADLYEVITLKQFSLLIQLIFLLIFLKLINNLKDNYGQSFLIAFKTFFNNFEFDALTNLKIEVGKTIKSKKIKFNNLIGGKIFLQEFNQTILILKNSKYGLQSNLNITKPEFNLVVINNHFNLYSKNNYYNNLFFNITTKQKNFIYNFVYYPFNTLFLNLNFTQVNKKLINNKSVRRDLKNTINIKGFLLVGPPGTGKTLLVKALSGESDVPIILESGEKLSKLNFQNETMSENAKGALQLKNLFNRAKKLSPCILFLDEIDNVGQNRKDVLTDYRKHKLKNYSTTNSLYFLSNNKINISLLNLNQTNNNNLLLNLKTNSLLNLKTNNSSNLKKKINNNGQLKTKSLSMLTQLLCELDGLKNRRDLVIIGATNRPKTLDPALTRPGRLNKIVYIDLPGKKKRFELLKFYSKNKINNNSNINWDFFANQTTGLSAAHLSSAINIALLKKIYNLKKEKNLKILNNNKIKYLNKFFLIQDFENIEYGIEIIKFKNISFKYKSYELGLLVNNSILNYNYYNQLKLLNLFNLSHFFLIYNKLYIDNINKKTLKTWLNKKYIKLTNLKKNLRTIFYKKNKKFIRYLYLLNKKSNTKIFFRKKKNYYILNKFYKYMNRLFKVHMFSCSLLVFSTYILNNPLIFSFTFLYNYLKFKININYDFIKNNSSLLTLNNNFMLFKYNNILKYKLIWYNLKLTNNIYFLTNKKFFYKKNNIFSINIKYSKYNNHFNQLDSKINKSFIINNNIFYKYYKTIYKKQNKSQQLILNDSIFINRMSYYLGGKSLLLNTLKKPIKNLNSLNLWLIKNKFEKNKIKQDIFIKTVIKKLITKEEFENYLLFLITGKISEIKFLFNNHLENISNLGINDLKEIGWLLNIMINKNYFYKTLKLKLFKQVLIQDLKNSVKINNKKSVTNQNNSNIKFEHKLVLLKNKFNKNFLLNKKNFTYFNSQKWIFWDLMPYWWEPNLKVKNLNIMYWSFSKSKKFNLLTLLYKNEFKYNYYYSFINNKLKLSNNFNSNQIMYLNKYFNIHLLTNFFKPEINWNSLLLMEYYILMSNIIFSLTNKIFNLLNTNNELLDYFSYYILCNERFYDFELNKISLKYYNKN